MEENEKIQGLRHIKYTSETTSIFRTDVRLNLDLKSNVKIIFLDKMRFFVEADNIFAPLDIKALKFCLTIELNQIYYVELV
jgi:hypothetical protein